MHLFMWCVCVRCVCLCEVCVCVSVCVRCVWVQLLCVCVWVYFFIIQIPAQGQTQMVFKSVTPHLSSVVLKWRWFCIFIFQGNTRGDHKPSGPLPTPASHTDIPEWNSLDYSEIPCFQTHLTHIGWCSDLTVSSGEFPSTSPMAQTLVRQDLCTYPCVCLSGAVNHPKGASK